MKVAQFTAENGLRAVANISNGAVSSSAKRNPSGWHMIEAAGRHYRTEFNQSVQQTKDIAKRLGFSSANVKGEFTPTEHKDYGNYRIYVTSRLLDAMESSPNGAVSSNAKPYYVIVDSNTYRKADKREFKTRDAAERVADRMSGVHVMGFNAENPSQYRKLSDVPQSKYTPIIRMLKEGKTKEATDAIYAIADNVKDIKQYEIIHLAETLRKKAKS